MNRTILFISLAMMFLGAAARARGDSVWIAAGAGGQALERKGVKIAGIYEGKLRFTSGGGDTSRELTQVARIAVDDEPALTAAETALAGGQLDPAIDNYRKAIDSTSKPWVAAWSAQRLLAAAQKANRFDAAAKGYIAFAIADPQRAAAVKPAVPQAASTFIATAINEVNAALADTKLTPPQRQALQNFLLDLQRGSGDQRGAATTAEKILQSDPTPAANGELAKLRLQAAAAALKNNDFARARSEIDSNRRAFTNPADQAQALFVLAEAQAGIAAQSKDANAWKDAALAYMRVPAHFPDGANAPLAAQALLKTAQIAQKLNDAGSARSLYQQVVQQYPTDPSAAAAQAALQNLK